jgi:hypothetical protein
MERKKIVKENDRLKSNFGSTSDDKICINVINKGARRAFYQAYFFPKEILAWKTLLRLQKILER